MKYWLPETVERVINSENPVMNHSASNQYKTRNTQISDEIWGVTVTSDDNRLILYGHMIVDWIGRKSAAAEILNKPESSLWDAEWFVISEDPEPFDTIDITKYAGDLRFISPVSKSLPVENGRVNGQHLQTMRELTPATIQLLRDIWYDLNRERIDEGLQSFSEGQRKIHTHYRYERSRGLIAYAKSLFKQKHGRLFCEVCSFDFTEKYGDLGDGFIEAHHRTPLSELSEEEEVETSLEDLAMVCSNCHSMLHRRRPWLTVEELKNTLHAQRKLQ